MQKFIEFMESFAIVSCKDFDNPNFQVWGAAPPGCRKKREKILKMRFKEWMRNKK
jgi:hypothetical protein